MSKKSVVSIAVILTFVVISLFSVMPLQSATGDNSRWMAELDDGRMINSLSIPGTHNTGSTHSIADLTGKCQSLTVAEQLQAGVRFLDVRLQLYHGKLRVVHSFMEQGLSFESFLLEVNDFLIENPTEFVFMSIKEDCDPVGPEQVFSEEVEAMLLGIERVSRATSAPKTVGDARGGIHIISRYKDPTIGVPAYDGWRDSASFSLGSLYVQDVYKVSDAEEKKAYILDAISVASNLEYDLTLNFTSCHCRDSFPPNYAGIPTHSLNPWLIDMLSEGEAMGVFLCDFITYELCEIIIGGNFR